MSAHRFLVFVLLAPLLACATRAPPYGEHCSDPGRPCTVSYDFEPSGAARDVFDTRPGALSFLVVNEDGVVFRWVLDADRPSSHDRVSYARSLHHVVSKVEAATSRVCDGVPVLLVASNFLPGTKEPAPERERVVAVVGSLDAEPRVLGRVSELVRDIGRTEGGRPRVEGLALSSDCRTLYVGLRAVVVGPGDERSVQRMHPIALDVDWRGEREEASAGEGFDLGGLATCSGRVEGLSDLQVLDDGTFVALTSYELETRPAQAGRPATGVLAGTLWRRPLAGPAERLACLPGHKPEALAVAPDGQSVRVICEDDEYGGRPIGVHAVRVPLGPLAKAGAQQ